MKAKGVVTAVLLLFVVASLAWLGVKEVARSNALKAAQAQPLPVAPGPKPETPPPAITFPVPPASFESPAALPKDSAPATASVSTPAPAKAGKPSADPPTPAGAPNEPSRTKIVVYYLHTTARCPSCLKIEAYTAAEVTGPLSGPLAAGKLEWKVLNVDEPNNAHFVQDYELYTKSVVVSEMKDGKEVRWKRLDKVWDYLGDRQAFMRYVDDEVRAYLKDMS